MFDDSPSLIRAPTPEGDEAEKDEEKLSTFPPLSVESLTLTDGDVHVPTSQSMASPPSSGEYRSRDFFHLGSQSPFSVHVGLHTLTFQCPGDRTGLIIGKGGKTIRGVESETDTSIKVHRNQFVPGANATVVITGTEDNCKKALFTLFRHVSEKIAMHTATTETIMIPSGKLCARVIGKGGSTLRM